MGRWESDTQGRLQRSALELFHERGFEQTTVSEIAGRAGLTERTFFRYYADKREVLFGGSAALKQLFVDTVAGAPAALLPMEVVALALGAAAHLMQDGREHSRQRQAVINANSSLQERELIKLASLAAAIAATLRQRGVTEPAASLAAEAGIAVFKIGFERWLEKDDRSTFPELIAEALVELRDVTAGITDLTTRTPAG